MLILISSVVVHGCSALRDNKVKRPNMNFKHQQNQGTKHIYISALFEKSRIYRYCNRSHLFVHPSVSQSVGFAHNSSLPFLAVVHSWHNGVKITTKISDHQYDIEGQVKPVLSGHYITDQTKI